MRAKVYVSCLLCLLVVTGTTSARAEDDPFGSGAKSGEDLPGAATDATVAEEAPDMQLAWDMWHKRVNTLINDRFNFLAKAAFKHSPYLSVEVDYDVTAEGDVVRVNVVHKSTNVLFNALAYQAIKSIDHSEVLKFPKGTARRVVANTFKTTWRGRSPGPYREMPPYSDMKADEQEWQTRERHFKECIEKQRQEVPWQPQCTPASPGEMLLRENRL